jgi:lipoprotein signal peptidase
VVGVCGVAASWLAKAHPPPHPVWVLKPAVFYALFINSDGLFGMPLWGDALTALGGSLFVVIAAGWFTARNHATLGWAYAIGAGSLTAGAGCNVLSRLILGGVPDFIGFRPLAVIDPGGQRDHFPLYSAGDLLFFVGAIVLLILYARSEYAKTRNSPQLESK